MRVLNYIVHYAIHTEDETLFNNNILNKESIIRKEASTNIYNNLKPDTKILPWYKGQHAKPF